MDSCISKSNTSESSSKQHLTLSLVIFKIFCGARKVLNCTLESLQGEDITDGVCTLISRSVDGICWPRDSFEVGDSGPALEAVA